jgi:stress response protein SCP2
MSSGFSRADTSKSWHFWAKTAVKLDAIALCLNQKTANNIDYLWYNSLKHPKTTDFRPISGAKG